MKLNDLLNVIDNNIYLNIVSILMIAQLLDSFTPKLADVISIVNILPYYEVIVYKSGKRLKRIEWLEYLTSSVHYIEFKDGILYIQIY